MTYAEKLKHPEWQKKRLKIMERDGFKCWGCGNKEKTLNIHHRVYIPGRLPWEYMDHILITLCDECHNLSHDMLKKVGIPLERALETPGEKLLELIELYKKIGPSGLEILKDDAVMEALMSMIKAVDRAGSVGFREGKESALSKEDE